MKTRRNNLQLAGIDVALPAVVAIEGHRTEAAKRIHVILGFAADGADGVIRALVGQWLALLCHRHFVEDGRADGDLAAAAFYDKLAWSFPDDAPVIAALVPQPRNGHVAEGSLSAPAVLENGRLARWKFRGRVRAYLNPATASAQVTFDDLPGGVALSSRNGLAASIARTFMQHHEACAWYGFGTPLRDPAEAVVALRHEIADRRRTAIAARASAHC